MALKPGQTVGRYEIVAVLGQGGFGITYRALDHQSTMGAYVGKLALKDGKGVMVDWIQEAAKREAAVIINPAGVSFGCVPVLDALKLLRKPLIEVHLTNIHAREAFRRTSYVSQVAKGVICGLGPQGYGLAIAGLAGLAGKGS